MNAIEAIKKVIIAEGGAKITEDKNDSGGLTKYGISQKAYPKLDIRNLTEFQAINIYKRDYWDRILGDSLPYNIAYALFNQSVVRGVGAAIMTAQRVVGVKVDGGMGNETLSKIIQLGEKNFLGSFLSQSIQEAEALVKRRPKDSKFLAGWKNRIQHISDYVGVKPVVAVGSTLALLAIGIFFLIFITSSKKTKFA